MKIFLMKISKNDLKIRCIYDFLIIAYIIYFWEMYILTL